MHVVIVDEELPYPLNSGKRIRTLNLILPLARRHQITYLCYPSADAEETQRAVEFFRQEGIETVLVERMLPGKAGAAFYGRLLWNLLSPLPYSVQVHNSAALRRAIGHYAAAHDVDLWHCEWTPYGKSLSTLACGPWIVIAHNVESLIWQRYCENEANPLKRWYIKRQWRKFERFERRMFSTAPLTVAVSESDSRLMREQFGADRLEVVDNGVDITYFQPNESVRDPSRLLFLGSLDWRPNLDGVGVLLDRIFPRVLAEEPSARLAIVGRKPPPWLVDRVRTCRGVELHADVPDVRPFLHQCGLMVVPLRIGGGSRLKILEALATECPVVSTRVGAEGLRLAPGRHFVQVETMDDMASALVEHIRNPRPIGEMACQGRNVVVQWYNWPVLSAKLEAIWLEQGRAGKAGQ
ncbi:MAG: glycosyltransferase family 4 protein [Pirellulales bacterium]|nr:glycosyltransferase family 4 protein [Pirellulales bacterium]